MNPSEVLKILKSSGALLEGHFELTSGLHSAGYIEKFRILEQPEYTTALGSAIAEHFKGENITVVAAPMTGGIILGYEVARQLGARSIFTERVEGKMKFRRGFSVSPEDRVLIVEDIITTGGSVKEVIEELKALNAVIVGIGYLIDRSGGKTQFDIPSRALLTFDITAYRPEDCPLCKAGLKAVKPGSKK